MEQCLAVPLWESRSAAESEPQQWAVGKAVEQTSGALNMIFAMYIVIPVILSVVITVILGFLNVEKANRKWDEEHAKEV